MSEQKISTEMLEAAAKAVIRCEANLHSCSLLMEEFYGEMAEAALRAAGVPALLKRIADAEQEMAKVREVLHDHSVYFEAELEKREVHIAELEADLKHVKTAKNCYYDCVSKKEANKQIAKEQEYCLEQIARPIFQQQAARIAELEAALRNRICEGCDKLMANVGQLHLCGCDDQRNLCGACKAGCACAGGE